MRHHTVRTPRIARLVELVSLGLVFLAWKPAQAQTPQVVNFSPGRYSLANAATTSISAQFAQAMDGSSIQATSFVVYGERTGYHSGSLAYNGASLTAAFTPDNPFQAGERVSVILTGDIRNNSGVAIEPFQWSFYIRATPGTAALTIGDTRPSGDGPHYVVSGELNGDTALDLAVAHSRSDNVFTWNNQGNGSFSKSDEEAVGESPRSLTVGDFDADNDLDIATVNELSSNITILDNAGGDFTPRAVTLAVGTEPAGILNSDLNNDGFLDLLSVDATAGSVSVLLNNGDGTFGDAVQYSVGATPQAGFIADYNNDGAVDVVTANSGSDNVSLLLNDGSGAFGPAQNSPVGAGPRGIYGHDFDRDGLIDVAVTNRNENTITVLFNLNGSFSLPSGFPVGSEPFGIIAGDIDGDLDADLLISNRTSNDLHVLTNSGNGFFEIDSVYTTGSQPRDLDVADFTGDGVLDVAVIDWDEDAVQIFFNEFLEVANQAPGPPSLQSPVDLGGVNPNQQALAFTWGIPGDPDNDLLHFSIVIDDNQDFTSPVHTADSAINPSGFSPTPPVAQGAGTMTYTLTAPLSEGQYWWRVTASDGVVTSPVSGARSFFVDTTTPVISDVLLTTPAFEPNWFNQNTTTSINFGVIYSESNADLAQFNLDALGGFQEQTGIPSGVDQSIEAPVSLVAAPDGGYALSVTVFDKAGNEASSGATVRLDGTAPTGARASSPQTSVNENFQVTWSAGSDGAGSGLSGFYTVRVRVNGGAWQSWLTNFPGTSAQFQGQDGFTYAFEAAAHDNVGNVEALVQVAESTTTVDATEDTTPPGPPVNLVANGLNPSPWQNNAAFTVSWQEPTDASGIDRALYKLGSAPTANFDTTGSRRGGSVTLNITATQENGQDLFVWFSDLSGNVNFQNRGLVRLRYDITRPSGTTASSPATSAEETFLVSWGSSGSDGNGSGLSGVFDIRVQTNGGAWQNWMTDFQGTSASYPGADGNTYGFEVAAHDVAGNVESFLSNAESVTTVDLSADDVQAPGPPPTLTAGGSSPSPWQNQPQFVVEWDEPADPSGIARALYKVGSMPTANFDTTGSVVGATSVTVTAEEENGESLYIWFEDTPGNVNFQSNGVVTLRYDSTPPSIFELDVVNAAFPPFWLDHGSTNSAEIEVNYDELHMRSIIYSAPGLGASADLQPVPSGIDIFHSFDIDIQGESDGIYDVFLVLTDSAGNTTLDTVMVGLDDTSPGGTTASSADTSGNLSFLVSWGGTGSDEGSGLSGQYNVQFQVNGGDWQDWLTDFQGGSEVFVGSSGNFYGFEAGAIDNLGNTERFTDTAQTITLIDTSFSDPVPPNIMHNQPLVVDQGQPQTFIATVQDNSQVTEVLFFFKHSGEVSFQPIRMTETGDNVYETTLTAEQIGSLGVNYFIRASDGQNFAFHPITNAASVPNNVSVRISGADNKGLVRDQAQPGGDGQQAYRMISIPLNVSDKSPLAVLQDDLGDYDRSQWRLYQYDAGSASYTEFPNVENFSPGTALWLITRDQNRVISSGVGVGVVTNQSFEISLSQGWNDFGLPFMFSVDWSDVQVVQGSADDIMGPYHFDGAWRSPDQVTTLLPWEGYSIFSATAGVRIAILPVSASTALAAARSVAAAAWEVNIDATCGSARNDRSRLGMASDASNGYDQRDYLEPPHISDYVSVRFPHRDWTRFAGDFLSDYRPVSNDGSVWEFEVATSIAGENVRLSFAGLETVPAAFAISLYDKDTLQRIDLRANPVYQFLPDQGSLKRKFELVIGTDEFVRNAGATSAAVPETFFLSQNFPNPFNAGTSIVYKVAEAADVEISVLNVLGQHVRALVSERQQPGTYRLNWDGRSELGVDVSSGIYLLRFRAGSFQQVRRIVLSR